MAGKATKGGKGLAVMVAVGKPKGGPAGKFAPTKTPKMGKSSPKGIPKAPPKGGGMMPPTFGPTM